MEASDVVHDESARSAPSGTSPHKVGVAVWGVPSFVRVGHILTVKAGLQCLSGCDMSGHDIELWEQAGAKVAAGRLGRVPWTGTDNLYWTEIGLTAPTTEGVCSWRATFTPRNDPDLELRHEGAFAAFSCRVDRLPEHTVTVRVVDKNTGTPVDDVEVRLGLYMVSTDERGLATIELPAGTFEVTIRRDGYKAGPTRVDVLKNLVMDIEAVVAPTRAEREASMTTMADSWG